MILAIDIGNSGTALGFYQHDTLLHHCKISSKPYKTEDEFIMLLKTFCEQNAIDEKEISGCAVSSVVPPLTNSVRNAVHRLFGCVPVIVGPGIKTGLNIRTDNQTQLGADIVANTVAAAAKVEKPFLIVDFGTATTITAVNLSGELVGVIIIPGVSLSADALSSSAAELPYISMQTPKTLIGKNTVDSMQSGCIFGAAAMIDGLIGKISKELKTQLTNIIATGGLADAIAPHCKAPITVKPFLTLDGLAELYRLNQKKSK